LILVLFVFSSRFFRTVLLLFMKSSSLNVIDLLLSSSLFDFQRSSLRNLPISQNWSGILFAHLSVHLLSP